MKCASEAIPRWVRVTLEAVAALAPVAIAIVQLWIGSNFGVVDPGHVYRCAQPEADLPRLLATHGVKSVLNLRGGSEDDPWYDAEVRITRDGHVDFYDLPISANRRPTRRELLILLDLFRRCRYPLLIHCKSGSDRTGLASGLYLMAGPRQEPPARACRALAIGYGHLGLFGTEHLHEPFIEYGAWLKDRGLRHTPERLWYWVAHRYEDDDPRTEFAPLHPGPRPRIAGGAATWR